MTSTGAMHSSDPAATVLIGMKLGPAGSLEPLSVPIARVLRAAKSGSGQGRRAKGVSTGIRDLDAKIGGLQPGDFVIIAGRPNMGAAGLATQIALHAAKSPRREADQGTSVTAEQRAGVAFFTPEMSAEQVAVRLVALEADVSGDRILRGEVRREELETIEGASARLCRVPMFVDDTPNLSIDVLQDRAIYLEREQGLRLIVIDDIDRLKRPGRLGKRGRGEMGLTIAVRLKALAMDLGVPVIATTRVSRRPERREDKRPTLSDLKLGRSVERPADIVIFVYRENYYLESRSPNLRIDDETDDQFNLRYMDWWQRCQDAHGKAEVIIAKHSEGPIGTVTLAYDGPTRRFSDLQEGLSNGPGGSD